MKNVSSIVDAMQMLPLYLIYFLLRHSGRSYCFSQFIHRETEASGANETWPRSRAASKRQGKDLNPGGLGPEPRLVGLCIVVKVSKL